MAGTTTHVQISHKNSWRRTANVFWLVSVQLEHDYPDVICWLPLGFRQFFQPAAQGREQLWNIHSENFNRSLTSQPFVLQCDI